MRKAPRGGNRRVLGFRQSEFAASDSPTLVSLAVDRSKKGGPEATPVKRAVVFADTGTRGITAPRPRTPDNPIRFHISKVIVLSVPVLGHISAPFQRISPTPIVGLPVGLDNDDELFSQKPKPAVC